jgi:hypothetical protein
MRHCTARRQARQIETLRTQFCQADGLPFADVLSADRFERALREERATWRDCVYTPALTLWAFLSQVIDTDGSCRQTVRRVLAWLVAQRQTPCTPKTGPYGKARQRLPEALLQRLLRETGRSLHDRAPNGWLWKGRRGKEKEKSTQLVFSFFFFRFFFYRPELPRSNRSHAGEDKTGAYFGD